MREWLYWHFPIITTRWRKNKYAQMICDNNIEATIRALRAIDEKTTWAAINPVIHSLKELRNNTWDKERVDGAIEWLERNFEVKE
jgi:hypothetical protein